jgi:ATP-dependent DNA helicase PIF1
VLRAVLEGHSVFFTGGAGVGKSFLLKQIVRRLPQRTTFVTASTGIAACAVGGVTIHHWAGVGSTERPVAEMTAQAMRTRGAQWRAAKTLVIDEVSMLDADLFDTLDAVARRVRGVQLPFGGLQLVLSGDFFQLPPVAKGGAPLRFAFEAAAWREGVRRTFELTQVFRQADPAFISALRLVRQGRAPAEVRELLKSCVGRALPEADGIVATRLFTHKADCAALNEARLAALPGPPLVWTARDTSRDAGALATLRTSSPAPAELPLKVGAQVMLIKTIDAGRGLVNGARGVVTKMLATRHPQARTPRRSSRCCCYPAHHPSEPGPGPS